MGLSQSNTTALKSFTPSILHKPNILFFEFMEDHKEKMIDTAILDTRDLFQQFLNYCVKDNGLKKFRNNSKPLKNSFEQLLNILHSIQMLSYKGEIITSLKWSELVEFSRLLKHITKSDERKIRWTIFYLVTKKSTPIELEDIKKHLKNFDISNIEKIIKKIFERKLNGINATFDGSKISVGHKDYKILVQYLIDDLEYTSRRSPMEIDVEILDLLDQGSYSNKELSVILDSNKAMISKAMTRLRKSNLIKPSSPGTRGSHYYTTNCNNCPFGLEREECRKNSLSYIVGVLKREFDVKLLEEDFAELENQGLLKIRSIILERRQENPLLERTIDKNLMMIFEKINLKKPVLSHGNYEGLLRFLDKLPILYREGFIQGLAAGEEIGSGIVLNAMKKRGKSIKKDKALRKLIVEEINKLNRAKEPLKK